jgi:mannonate dehydratase
MKNNRRDFIKKSASLTAAISVSGLSSCTGSGKKDSDSGKLLGTAPKKIQWPVPEGPDTPKIILTCGMNATPEEMRMLKQIGADYVLTGGPALPWTESGLRACMDRFRAEGLTVLNMMLPGMSNIIYNRTGRDEEIKQVQDSLRAAGAAGLPIVEYNFYAHRLIEGYYSVAGRGGAGYLAYDYNRTDTTWEYPTARAANEASTAPKDLTPLPGIGEYSYEQLWDNITYFLKAVIPVAEKAGVRMALHPNDPPVPVSRGSHQIMGTFNDWKRLVNIVDSPSNGMTYDCGVSNELGEDPLEVLDYLISRDRINHVHYRNCIVETPRTKYVEVFQDNGTVDMFAVMEQLVQRKYKFGLYPEHPRSLDYDKAHPGGGSYAGWVYTTAYARAMMQAVLTLEKRAGI